MERKLPLSKGPKASDLPQRDLRQEAQAAELRNRYLTHGGVGTASVTLAATSVTVTLVLEEVDALYGVLVTPNWKTTFGVTAKTTTAFTVDFGTAAPASASIDWITFRS